MKKLSLLTAAAVATLALAGCSQDGIVNEAPSANQAIEFGTYLGRDAQGQTRATATDLEYVQTNGFGVFAYYTQKTPYATYNKTKPNFMYNQRVADEDKNDTWTYTPVKYWPNNTDDKVSFVAYAPHNANSTITIGADGTAALKIKYTVTNAGEGTTDKSKDLLYTDVIADKTKQNLSGGEVEFTFKHALSRIGFTVQGAIDQAVAGGTIDGATTITVKKVMLSGTEHTYNGQGSVAVSTTSVFYKSANLDLLTGGWSDYSTDKLLFTLESKNFVNKQNVTLSGSQATATKLTNEDSYLMIIPQDFTNTDMYVYVEYTVTTTDSGTTNNTPATTNNNSVITNYISTKAPINFEKGKAYTINLVLGMNSVDLDVNENISWGDETNKDVNLPLNN